LARTISGMNRMRTLVLIVGLMAGVAALRAGAALPTLIWTAAAGPADMARFELPARKPSVVNAVARSDASARIPLPSYGSGLVWLGGDTFLGITDRGPNAS